jgi:hypothetical protein
MVNDRAGIIAPSALLGYFTLVLILVLFRRRCQDPDGMPNRSQTVPRSRIKIDNMRNLGPKSHLQQLEAEAP